MSSPYEVSYSPTAQAIETEVAGYSIPGPTGPSGRGLIVLPPGQPIPADTPPNTVVFYMVTDGIEGV